MCLRSRLGMERYVPSLFWGTGTCLGGGGRSPGLSELCAVLPRDSDGAPLDSRANITDPPARPPVGHGQSKHGYIKVERCTSRALLGRWRDSIFVKGQITSKTNLRVTGDDFTRNLRHHPSPRSLIPGAPQEYMAPQRGGSRKGVTTKKGM